MINERLVFSDRPRSKEWSFSHLPTIPRLSPPSFTPIDPPIPTPSFSDPDLPTIPRLSPPPSTPIDPPRPTLSETMFGDLAPQSRKSTRARMLTSFSEFPYWTSSDICLTVKPAGALFGFPMDLQREVLVRRSSFFAEKLGGDIGSDCYILEIPEQDDWEFYVEALLFMYSEDLKTKLVALEVSEVLRLLKVCLSISFDDAVTACLEYLKPIPLSGDEVDKVRSCLTVPLLYHSVLNPLRKAVAGASTSSRANAVSS